MDADSLKSENSCNNDAVFIKEISIKEEDLDYSPTFLENTNSSSFTSTMVGVEEKCHAHGVMDSQNDATELFGERTMSIGKESLLKEIKEEDTGKIYVSIFPDNTADHVPSDNTVAPEDQDNARSQCHGGCFCRAAKPLGGETRRRCPTRTVSRCTAVPLGLPPAAVLSKLKVVCLLEAEGLLKEPTCRRNWVHPFRAERETNEKFEKFYENIRKDDEKFFDFYRMTKASFDELLQVLRPHISKQDTLLRRAISAEERLTVTLRYLATGCSMTELHNEYRLGKSTISGILREVCAVIWARLKTVHMPEMSKERWEEVTEGFQKDANFPNCIGAIDGKHIRLVQPKSSTVLLAVCDANYSFTYVDIGAYGESSDSAIFTHSLLYKKLVEYTLDVPDPKPISTDDARCLPHVIVGNEAFGIMENVMRPYSGRHLSYKKKIFNYRLSRARRYIECTFGILANKWRIFHRPLNVNIDFAEDIIKACCILHNYVRARDGYRYKDTLHQPPMVNLLEGNVPRGGMYANSARDSYADYFVNEGKIEWQDRMI